VNRWLSVRFNLTSSAIVGVTGVVVLLTPGIDASLAGFALAFVSSVTGDVRNHQLLVYQEQMADFFHSSCSWSGGSLD
jgi:hypothetical protein